MKNLLIIPAVLVSSLVYAQPNIQWQKAYGGSDYESPNEIKRTNDGGYIFSGTTNSSDGDITTKHKFDDVFVVKTDKLGKILWKKCYGGDSTELAASIEPTDDGGYILLATTSSVNGDVAGKNGNRDMWLVKLTATGTISWEQTYGGTNQDIARSLVKTSDGGYVLLGYTSSGDGDVTTNKGATDIWVVKTNATGTIVWEKTYGGSSSESGAFISRTSDGGYLVAGETNSTDGDVTVNKGQSDYWVLKLTSTGGLAWQKTYGGSMTDLAYRAIETADGGVIIAGTSVSTDKDITNNKGQMDVWMVKTDGSGAIEWQKSFGGTLADLVGHILQQANGKYLVSGHTYSNDGDVSGLHGIASDIWITRLNTDGTLDWSKTIGGTGAEYASNIIETGDGGYIIGGATQSSDGDATNSGHHGSNDFWLVKLSSPVAVDNIEQNSKINVYPTLTDGVVNIELEQGLDNAVLHLYNTTGQLIHTDNTSGLNRSMNLSSELPGMYILEVSNNEYSFKYKIVNAPR